VPTDFVTQHVDHYFAVIIIDSIGIPIKQKIIPCQLNKIWGAELA